MKVDMSNDDVIKISDVAYTESEARVLVGIINVWLDERAAQPSVRGTADGACESCGNNCWKLVCETCGAE